MRDVQTRSIIRQVGLVLLSHREMPSLLQGQHSQTATEAHVHGEIVRRRIAGRAGRAVEEITGLCHQGRGLWCVDGGEPYLWLAQAPTETPPLHSVNHDRRHRIK